MLTFTLIAVLCLGTECNHVPLDNNLSVIDCDSYFTDRGVAIVDKLVYAVAQEQGLPYNGLEIQGLACVVEDTD